MIKKIIFSILILFLGGFLNHCFADEPAINSIIMNNIITVNSGSSIEESTIKVLANENVYLTGTYSNCNIDHDNPTIKWFKNNFVNVEEIGIGDSITIQTAYSGSYFATLYCKGDPFNSLGFNIEIQSKKSGGGSSYSSRMRREAESLFYDTGSIDKIQLNLKLEKQKYSPIMKFYWDGIGGNGQVNYIFEYSTGSNFSTGNTISFNTTESFYQFIEYGLDINSFIHYFKVKACYGDKCSDYSDIVRYYSEDYLPLTCKKEIETIDYSDVFDYDDSFIDDYFQVKCTKCNIKKKHEKDENKLLDLNYKIFCTKCNLSSYKNENNSFFDNYNVKCQGCKEIEIKYYK